MSYTRRFGAILGILVSVVLLVFLFAQIDWQLFFHEARQLRLWCVPVVCVLTGVTFWLRALRWRLLLPSELDIATLRLFNGLTLGTLASFVLPLRAGEFVRPWVLSRSQPVSFSLGFASVVTERVFDVLVMLLFLVACLTQIPSAPPLIILGGKALGLVALVILLAMLTAYFQESLALRIIENSLYFVFRQRMRFFQERFIAVSSEFIAGLRSISTFRELIFVLLWSLLIWSVYGLMYYVVIAGFGQWPSFWVAITLTVFVALAVAAPSAPGFLGTFQLGCVGALQYVYHYSEEFALAFAVVAHVLQFVSIVVLGLYSLRSEGIGIQELRDHGQS